MEQTINFKIRRAGVADVDEIGAAHLDSIRSIGALAVERYKKGEASLGRAAELAGVPVGQMMTILMEFGVESRLEKEDYLQGLKNLQKVW